MRVIALGLALGVAVACTSGLESYKIERDLKEKGEVAMQEAHDMMERNRPEAATAILRRHIHYVDDAIDKVTKDALINDRDKTQMLQRLREYRRDLAKILQTRINLEYEIEWADRR